MAVTHADEVRDPLTFEEGLALLKPLVRDIQSRQFEVGKILWRMDLGPSELVKLAEQLDISVETLKSWKYVYSRLRDSHARLSFSYQLQLARIEDKDDREKIWQSRPSTEWTFESLRKTVETYLLEHNPSPFGRSKKAGCRATLVQADLERGIPGKEARVKLELRDSQVIISLDVTKGLALGNFRDIVIGDESHQLIFDLDE